MQFFSRHKLIIIIAALLVALFVWWGLSGSSSGSPSLLSTQAPAGGATNQDLVSTLLALRAVKLDGTIFSNPAFVGLQDFSTAITLEQVGRPNPFAPLGGGASPSASSTKGAQIFTPRR